MGTRHAHVTDIPSHRLRHYRCWLCEAGLHQVARWGCQGRWDTAGCNARGNGRLRDYHAGRRAPPVLEVSP